MRRFNPTKKEIEAKMSEAQSHLSEARQFIRDDQFTDCIDALEASRVALDDTNDLVSQRWAAVDHHREELIEYHMRELTKLRDAPEAVNESPDLKAVE